MNIPVTVKILLRAVLGPTFAVLALSRINLFSYITFIPVEYQYEVGLTAYLAFAEAVLEIVERYGENSSAKITCIFYKKANEININNTPAISCSAITANCATIKCKIVLAGSPKVLRRIKLNLVLPDWLSSQVEASNRLLNYKNQTLSMSFEKIIPRNNQKSVYIEEEITIPFIQNADEGTLLSILKPDLDVPWYDRIRLMCIVNSFQISNKEE